MHHLLLILVRLYFFVVHMNRFSCQHINGTWHTGTVWSAVLLIINECDTAVPQLWKRRIRFTNLQIHSDDVLWQSVWVVQGFGRVRFLNNDIMWGFQSNTDRLMCWKVSHDAYLSLVWGSVYLACIHMRSKMVLLQSEIRNLSGRRARHLI